MDVFAARTILSEQGLFVFKPEANQFLENYVKAFQSDDEHENQFRSNIGSIAAAEFSVLRPVLHGKRVETPQAVLELDAKLAIFTADTLRTRPCRTSRTTKRGRYSTSDLFMLSGEASKAWYVLDEIGSNVAEVDSVGKLLALREGLYGKRDVWETQNLADLTDSGLDRFVLLFAFMRMNVIRNLAQSQTIRDLIDLRKSLRL
jgi:hypothetical protein